MFMVPNSITSLTEPATPTYPERVQARTALGGLVGVILAALLCAPSARAQNPRAELPTCALGEQWFRSDGGFELTGVDADRYVFTASGGREVHLAKDLAPLRTGHEVARGR
jgi:hypothetical protein